jgi:hypothetical protein
MMNWLTRYMKMAVAGDMTAAAADSVAPSRSSLSGRGRQDPDDERDDRDELEQQVEPAGLNAPGQEEERTREHDAAHEGAPSWTTPAIDLPVVPAVCH